MRRNPQAVSAGTGKPDRRRGDDIRLVRTADGHRRPQMGPAHNRGCRQGSWPVSRILSLCGDLSMRPTRRVGGPRQPLPIWSCFRRGLPGRPIAGTAGELLPHHFTLTRQGAGSGNWDQSPCTQRPAPWTSGTFLLHFPSDRSAPACLLRDSTGVLPCEVRTFLPDCSRPPPGQLQSYSTRASGLYNFRAKNRHQTER